MSEQRSVAAGSRPLWPSITLLCGLAFPVPVLVAVASAGSAITGSSRFGDLIALALPIACLLGVALVGYAFVLAAGVARQPGAPNWIPVVAWGMVIVGGLVHLFFLILILTPGLVELP